MIMLQQKLNSAKLIHTNVVMRHVTQEQNAQENFNAKFVARSRPNSSSVIHLSPVICAQLDTGMSTIIVHLPNGTMIRICAQLMSMVQCLMLPRNSQSQMSANSWLN